MICAGVAPALGRALLKEAEGVSGPVRQVLQPGFLYRGGDGDDRRLLGEVHGDGDVVDDLGVRDLDRSKAVDVGGPTDRHGARRTLSRRGAINRGDGERDRQDHRRWHVNGDNQQDPAPQAHGGSPQTKL
jgi:hypothetical protein